MWWFIRAKSLVNQYNFYCVIFRSRDTITIIIIIQIEEYHQHCIPEMSSMLSMRNERLITLCDRSRSERTVQIEVVIGTKQSESKSPTNLLPPHIHFPWCKIWSRTLYSSKFQQCQSVILNISLLLLPRNSSLMLFDFHWSVEWIMHRESLITSQQNSTINKKFDTSLKAVFDVCVCGCWMLYWFRVNIFMCWKENVNFLRCWVEFAGGSTIILGCAYPFVKGHWRWVFLFSVIRCNRGQRVVQLHSLVIG